MKKRIVLFDDETGRAERWARQLEKLPIVAKNFEPQVMGKDAFQQAFEQLEQRRRAARKGETNWEPGLELDSAAILVVDYDLFRLGTMSYLTGETVAYLARCYSRCGLIIALNAYGKNPFDLTLRGHPESYADLNLGDTQLHNLGLWEEPWKGFRPWAWPLIPRALDAYENRIKEVGVALKKSIISFLGFESMAPLLPRSTVEFIESKKRGLEETTFHHFIVGSRQGLRPGDKPLNDEAVARIVAARIHKWLERLVLPGQDFLVDVPHLASRFPSLLKGDRLLKKTWNDVMTFGLPSKKAMATDLIEQFRFTRENWVSRPCWFWGDLSNYGDIDEVGDPWKAIRKADVVFCEDISAFELRSKAKEFVADLPSPFVSRYVRGDAKQADYQPLVRFAL